MKNLLYSVIVMAFASVSCNKTSIAVDEPSGSPVAGGFTNYIIRTGNHYCDQSQVKFINTNAVKATVIFDSSAIYASVLAENQRDINKLLGFSDCGTEHQENSARLGWSWNGQQVVIYAYAYIDKIRTSKTMGTVNLNQPFTCSVSAVKGYFQFRAGTYADSIARHCSDYTGSRYKLYPYFGGDEAAPHDVHIAIAEE